jgi:hypothetical protein
MLEAKSDFALLFPSKTVHQERSETTAERAPTEAIAEPSQAQYPICRVVMREATPATQRNSTDSFLDVVYAIEVATGQEQQSVLRDATWAIFRAMLGWETYIKDVVTWNSKLCVYDVDAQAIGFTDKDLERNRGTNQWISVWSTKIRFQFATTDLETL